MKVEKENKYLIYDLWCYLKDGCACVSMAPAMTG